MEQIQSNFFAFDPRYEIRDAAPLDAWRYTIRSIPIENRIITINKKQYNIDRKLGSGAFGTVYAARQLPNGKQVGIKVVSLATMNNAEAEGLKEAFLNEIKMAKRLAKRSNHIVDMYDFDFHAHTGLTFIVMELGQEDLEKALSKRAPLSPSERKAVWRQLVDIAITLHDRQIVHLDIKPSNLVVFPGYVIKLVDMGIAQKADRRRIGPNGTIPYSAPEVTTVSFFHMTRTTTKADVWSWGAVLYRMTYQVPPNYTPPSYRPPPNQNPSRDSHLLSVLRHTLVPERERSNAPWLVHHPYTKTH